MGRAPLGIALSLEKDLTGQRLDNGEPPRSLLFFHPQCYSVHIARGDGLIWRDDGLLYLGEFATCFSSWGINPVRAREIDSVLE